MHPWPWSDLSLYTIDPNTIPGLELFPPPRARKSSAQHYLDDYHCNYHHLQQPQQLETDARWTRRSQAVTATN
ncbi:hypothetical protein O9K51_00353 [Purpureocillium lavendulum]|uniref:Uncharacterized protein n=1 Tax=Purpureocillium lavendulum TaxID=1247861 RepID=A0AB34G4G5_9HYPO|nr:hypothetical protein O9K51_00353 [Purpureocillium lavendulum]